MHAGRQAKAKQSKPSFERHAGLGEMLSGGFTTAPGGGGHPTTRSLASASTCVLRLCFHHTPYTPEL